MQGILGPRMHWTETEKHTSSVLHKSTRTETPKTRRKVALNHFTDLKMLVGVMVSSKGISWSSGSGLWNCSKWLVVRWVEVVAAVIGEMGYLGSCFIGSMPGFGFMKLHLYFSFPGLCFLMCYHFLFPCSRPRFLCLIVLRNNKFMISEQ